MPPSNKLVVDTLLRMMRFTAWQLPVFTSGNEASPGLVTFPLMPPHNTQATDKMHIKMAFFERLASVSFWDIGRHES